MIDVFLHQSDLRGAQKGGGKTEVQRKAHVLF